MVMNNVIVKKNIFQEGKIVHGDSFIGRHAILSDMMQAWNESDGNGTHSVVGLNRMGKSSLVHELRDKVKEIDPTTICVIVSLGQNTWPDLIQLIMKMILRESEHLDAKVKRICEDTCNINLGTNNSLNENEIALNYKELLEHFSKINQHFLLVIDEFDVAKVVWKNKLNYFEGLRESVQLPGFYILVSRRPLEIIEMDSYGNSCFHNVFTEIHVCAFDRNQDMAEYYNILSGQYGIELNEAEREKVEEYTGFCPTFLAGLGNRLASAAINHKPQPHVEDVFMEQSFQTNYQRHYNEFLKRMTDDGSWDELVQIIMDISSIRITPDSEDPFREAAVKKLCCRGYLRQKQDGEYIVFSDDFTSWAKNKLYHNEISTIYSRIIGAEIAIREMLKMEMPKIWSVLYPSSDWENDFLNNRNVPVCAEWFTRISGLSRSKLQKYLQSAQRYDSTAGVADALTIKVKLALVKEYWEHGIKDRFNHDTYSQWKDCFTMIKDIRNPLFHATITSGTSQHYYLLKDANECSNMIIEQLS